MVNHEIKIVAPVVYKIEKVKKVNTLFNYIGGKGWLKNQLNAELEAMLQKKSFTTYCEPFAGGLGAFLNIAQTLKNNDIKKVILSDVNATLIHFYELVLSAPHELIEEYDKLEKAFEATIPLSAYSLHKTKEKEVLKSQLDKANDFYQTVRTNFNNKLSSGVSAKTDKNYKLKISAHLLFLQNHCFNGVYRENSKGHYNTPFNWEAKIFTKEKIAERIISVHKIFNSFELELNIGSFESLDYNASTLYYVDPPYFNDSLAPENKYHKDFFDMKKQELLLDKIKNTSFVYSNHDSDKLVEKITTIIPGKLKIQKIARKNIISASVASRQTDKIELLVSQLI